MSQTLTIIDNGDVFSAKPLELEKAYFIAKMSGLAMVRPTSSDFWKVP